MSNNKNTQPIGVFDSGIGGVSVLGEMVKHLPDEKYIYLADSGNAPYGTKDCESVRNLSVSIAQKLYAKGIKALVVACNTATSAAINHIRQAIDIPVIGMEPALKPAVEMGKQGCIVVMATPLTLKEEKFNSLYQKYYKEATIIPLPCPGLVELIESEAAPPTIQDYLGNLFKNILMPEVSAVVLGCTHYCFVRDEIQEMLGDRVAIVDGNAGTVKHLQNILQAQDLQAPAGTGENAPDVEFLTTGNPELVVPSCRRFLTRAIDKKS